METLTAKQAHSRNSYEMEDYVPPGDASTILLGHKNGFPVYDIDWNRDGRTLLSAGGDGTVRLWDTMAVGPFGRLANIRRVSQTHGIKSHSLSSKNKEPSTLNVPGERAESLVEVSGAALACYRGHSPSTPVWSAAFAPCGYYFASAGSDATARLWCTDRPAPIRIFNGHFSPSVNNVTWHPNCNYLLSSGDDKTARLWDIQTGRCIRILSGSSSGIGIVKVCPSGKYAAGADYSGIVHIWELGSGKKVNELRHLSDSDSSCNIQSLCYSACGTALATGCDDFSVRIWDVKGIDVSNIVQSDLNRVKFGEKTPEKIFKTRQTSILDLQYSQRNLLFAVGKYS
jgi:transcription initiation factor TFIID subunit 5